MPAIKNFGYLWDRDRVFWGHQGVRGTLLGARKNYPKVDFRDQKGVYILHSENLRIVYVGQVGAGDHALFDRLKDHTQSRQLWNRWRYFSWFGLQAVNRGNQRLAAHGGGSPKIKGTAEAFLDEIEAVLIQTVEPPLNKQGPKWKSATLHFHQLDDPALERSDLPHLASRLAEMDEKLSILVAKSESPSKDG